MHRLAVLRRYAAVVGILLLVVSVCVLSVEAKTATFYSPQQHLSKHCKAPEVADQRVEIEPVAVAAPLVAIDPAPSPGLPVVPEAPVIPAPWISPAHSLRAPPAV